MFSILPLKGKTACNKSKFNHVVQKTIRIRIKTKWATSEPQQKSYHIKLANRVVKIDTAILR